MRDTYQKKRALTMERRRGHISTFAGQGSPLTWHRSLKGDAKAIKETLGKHSWLPWKLLP